MIPAFTKYRSGGGGGGVFSIADTSTNNNASSISVPAGAAVGDMLVLALAKGDNSTKTLPAGFTTIHSSAAGAIGYRVMQAGDSSFSFGSNHYATLTAIRKASGSPAFDQSADSVLYTANGTYQTPTLTPATTPEASLMIFLSSWGPFSTAPGYTNLITYNVSGTLTCGMAMSWNELTAGTAFTGTNCNGQAGSYPAVAVHALFK